MDFSDFDDDFSDWNKDSIFRNVSSKSNYNLSLLELRFKNFKSYSSEQIIPVKPITLLFGANSSGKSSILQLLLLIKQSDIKNELNYNGKSVNLGSFDNIINNHDKSLFLDISMSTGNSTYIKRSFDCSNNVTSKLVVDGEDISFKSDNDISQDSKIFNSIFKSIITHKDNIISNVNKLLNAYNDNNYDVATGINDDDIRLLKKRLLKFENMCSEGLDKLQSVPPDIFSLRKFITEPKIQISSDIATSTDGEDIKIDVLEIELSDPLAKSVSDAKRMDRKLLKLVSDLEYIGPLRQLTDRYYIKDINFSDSVGSKGEYIVDMLASGSNTLDELNNWFKKLKIPYEVEISKFNDVDVTLYFLKLKDLKTNIFVSPPDVGFGISQIMPVIIQSVASNNKLILVEQPEIHIHPKLQAEMADLFIARSKGPSRNVFMLETHSEHLMLRILRRIRETSEGLHADDSPLSLKPEDVSVLYVQSSKEGSQVVQIPINSDGRFGIPWPEGFFAERAKELF